MTESVKQKTDEIDRLNAKIKTLEENNQEYKTKLQELPQLQERINYLEKRGRLSVYLSIIASLIFLIDSKHKKEFIPCI